MQSTAIDGDSAHGTRWRLSQPAPASDNVNLFDGVIKKVKFLGSVFDSEIQIRETVLRIVLDSSNILQEGQAVVVHIPQDQCQAVL